MFEFARFWEVVGGARHRDYKHVVDYDQLCRTLATGVGMDTLLRRFNRRETKEAFEQRVNLTVQIVTPLVSNAQSVFRKVPRADFQRVLFFDSGQTDNKAERLERACAVFHDGKSVDQWAGGRLLDLCLVAPNSFVVTEWGNFDYQREAAKPYPFEASAAMCVDFGFDNRGELLYLIVKTGFKASESDAVLEKYTLYTANQTFAAFEVEQKKGISQNNSQHKKVKDKFFRFEEYTPHNLGFVPAFRAGYAQDTATDGRTRLSIIDGAIPFYLKIIALNSEADLTKALHAFPLVIRVAEDCSATGCNGGWVHPQDGSEKHACQTCGGSGKSKPTSAQEEIVLSVPRSPEEVVSLDNLFRYVSPPIDILNWQSEQIRSLCEQAKAAIFNSDVFTKQQVSDTATGKRLDYQNVYDTLLPFAQQFAYAWQFVVQVIAKLNKLDGGLVAYLKFNRDFKLKSYDELLADLQIASQSDASPIIRRHVERSIAQVMFADAPEDMLRYNVRERFNPFSGHSKESILYFMSSELVDQYSKVLYANMGQIFDQLEREQSAAGGDFYLLSKDRQQQLLTEKVNQIIENQTQRQRLQVPQFPLESDDN